MPDLPIKPPNKRVGGLTTEITLDIFEKFKTESDLQKRNNEIINYLIKQIAILKANIELIGK